MNCRNSSKRERTSGGKSGKFFRLHDHQLLNKREIAIETGRGIAIEVIGNVTAIAIVIEEIGTVIGSVVIVTGNPRVKSKCVGSVCWSGGNAAYRCPHLEMAVMRTTGLPVLIRHFN